jgi:hypothetical protein
MVLEGVLVEKARGVSFRLFRTSTRGSDLESRVAERVLAGHRVKSRVLRVPMRCENGAGAAVPVRGPVPRYR